jgi:hypothetical protein
MSRQKTYRAEAARDGAWWYVYVPEIGHSTQAKRLEKVEHMVRDLIALAQGIPADSFGVEAHVRLPECEALIDAAREARARLQVSQDEAHSATLAAASALRDAGLPLRDVGDLLGLTHQRIAQLMASRGEVGATPDPST